MVGGENPPPFLFRGLPAYLRGALAAWYDEGMKNKTNLEAIKILVNSKKTILNHLKRVIKIKSFNYRTFGVDIEPHISNILVKIFRKRGLIKNSKDYKIAPNKNYFPDFELKKSPSLAIEYKSGNTVKLSKGRQTYCKNSNNDMGTLNMWQKKIKEFGGENIYYIFVIYKFDKKSKNIIDVHIGPFYRFIGLNKEGLLKYREKDGNLRPKDFDEDSPIKSLGQFQELFKKTVIYRCKRIIKKCRTVLLHSKLENKGLSNG